MLGFYNNKQTKKQKNKKPNKQQKMNFSRENQTKAGYSVCFAHQF